MEFLHNLFVVSCVAAVTLVATGFPLIVGEILDRFFEDTAVPVIGIIVAIVVEIAAIATLVGVS